MVPVRYFSCCRRCRRRRRRPSAAAAAAPAKLVTFLCPHFRSNILVLTYTRISVLSLHNIFTFLLITLGYACDSVFNSKRSPIFIYLWQSDFLIANCGMKLHPCYCSVVSVILMLQLHIWQTTALRAVHYSELSLYLMLFFSYSHSFYEIFDI